MLQGKFAELLALAVIAGATEKHTTDKAPLHTENGEINPLGAMAGLGAILLEGLPKATEAEYIKGISGANVPNFSKAFHKMGINADMVGFAIDIGVLKEFTQQQRTETFMAMLDATAKLQALADKYQAWEDHASLEVRRAKGFLIVGDYFYTAETGDEIQQLESEHRKDFFYNIGFTHATDAQIEAHLKAQAK